MKTDIVSKEPALHVAECGVARPEPFRPLRSLGWAFLPPAFASVALGTLSVFVGFETDTAIFCSAFFVLALLFSPEKSLLDWYGLCFATASVGFIACGHPISIVFGGFTTLFAILTLFDNAPSLGWKRRLGLLALYMLGAGLTAVVYLMPVWATLGLAILYMFFYVIVRLLPLGLLARASLMDDDT